MQIKDLARRTGVDTETIRYYEKQGLLSAPARRDNGYRDYGEAHLEQLAFIRHCRALDMPLAEVHQLLGFLAQPGGECGAVEALVDGHLARVRARLASMAALEKQLLRLRERCHGGLTDPSGQAHCGILDELVAAAHGEACACHPDRSEATGSLNLR